MNIAQWCIKNNRTFAVIILALAFMGVSTYFTISRLEDPEFTVRTALVVTYFPGAEPQKVEDLVTEPLEIAIREIGEVEHVRSESMAGMSLIMVDVYEKYDDMKPIWDRLRTNVADVAPSLPAGVIGPSINDQFGDVFGIVVSLRGDGYTYRELADTADEIRDELLALGDVAKVQIFGEQQETVFIEFSGAQLAELGVSPAVLIGTLQEQNAITPAGSALVSPERVVLEVTGEFDSIEDIRRMTIGQAGAARNLVLGDFASIYRGYEEPPAPLTRFNGERCLMLAVNMAPGGNIEDLGERVGQSLRQIESHLPLGLDLDFVTYQPKFVTRAIDEFMVNLVEAFAFVVIVMLVFAGLRTAIVAGMLVPMAILVCLALMPVFDVVLQRVSIASLIIALGMLVDNGVVVSEAILVRLSAGEDRMRAVTGAVSSLWIPLIAASLTTIFAFLPIATAPSAVGEYCLSMFIVITLTLLGSWVLSLTFVPFLCYYLLKPAKTAQSFETPVYRAYRRVLLMGLRHRALVLGSVAALFAVSVWGFATLPQTFFPPNERDMFILDFWQPYGTDITTTSARAAELEAWLMEQPETDSVGVFVGSGGPRWYLSLNVRQNNPNYAFFIVNTTTIDGAVDLLARTRAFIAEHLPDTRADVKPLENGPPVGEPIQIRLSGRDMDTLYNLRDRLAAVLADTDGVMDIWDDWGEWRKKLVVHVNQDSARRAGVTSRDIAFSLGATVNGYEASQLREGDDQLPIVLQLRADERQGLGRIEDTWVYSLDRGLHVPLSQVATPALPWQPSDIRRRDHVRTMTVKATISGRFATEILAEIQPRIAQLMAQPEWPQGYGIEYGGEQEETAKAQNSIFIGLPLAMALILLTLIAQFNSIRRLGIILLTIPPMLIGIAFGLHLTSTPFGFMAMLGMISLMGIIINNAIILIDAIEIERAEGSPIPRAIVMAAQKRLRPIVMTACTTIIGLIPLSLQGGEMWRPLANTIIFGLGFATFLTLGLAPVLYSAFFRARFDGADADHADSPGFSSGAK